MQLTMAVEKVTKDPRYGIFEEAKYNLINAKMAENMDLPARVFLHGSNGDHVNRTCSRTLLSNLSERLALISKYLIWYKVN